MITMDTTRIPRMELELKLKRKDCGKKEDTGDIPFIYSYPYKMELIL
jgi:hypothetical protein